MTSGVTMTDGEINSLNLLKEVLQEVIDRAANFRMSVFIQSNTEKYYKDATFEEHITCGTVACANGWFRLKHRNPDEHRLFNEIDVYNWLFNTRWEYIAPRPEDVITRIDWLLKNGLDQLKKRVTPEKGWGWPEKLWKTECLTPRSTNES